MSTQIWKWLGITVLFAFIIGLIAFAEDTGPVTGPLTAQISAEEQAKKEEIDMLTKRIQSGSLLWDQASKREKVWHDEKIRQEQGTAGYRHTLCTKYQKIVTESGALLDAKLSSDGSSCLAIQGF